MTQAKRIFGSSLALLAGWMICAAAQAQSTLPTGPALPLTQFGGHAQSVLLDSQGVAWSGAYGAIAQPSAFGPSLRIHGDGRDTGVPFTNEANASALWEFQISGPLGVEVPILIRGLYSIESSNALGVAGGIALGVDRFRLDRVLSFRCLSGDRSGCDSSRGGLPQSFILHETAVSGFETFILISLGGSTQGALPGTLGVFNGFLDPLISIDPTFARASEFTLFVSPDAGSFVAGIPEPEMYLLMLAGLAIVAAVSRRRHRA